MPVDQCGVVWSRCGPAETGCTENGRLGVGAEVSIFSLTCPELFLCQLAGRERRALISVVVGGFEPA